jgi:hypothetical protein
METFSVIPLLQVAKAISQSDPNTSGFYSKKSIQQKPFHKEQVV